MPRLLHRPFLPSLFTSLAPETRAMPASLGTRHPSSSGTLPDTPGRKATRRSWGATDSAWPISLHQGSAVIVTGDTQGEAGGYLYRGSAARPSRPHHCRTEGFYLWKPERREVIAIVV